MTDAPAPPTCPLCATAGARWFHRARGREFFRCDRCALTFVPPAFHLPAAAEKSRYDHHRNGPHDAGYCAFLRPMVEALAPLLPPGAAGLDFGCGPGPTLHLLFAERGFPMQVYDPNYAPETSVLARTWAFITCTETVEHFREPDREFARFDVLLQPGGWLGIMTARTVEDERFPRWHYINDDTHLCFYDQVTLEWVARRHGWEARFPGPNLALFHKPRAQ